MFLVGPDFVPRYVRKIKQMANDERRTPQWFYDRLDAIFHFQIDVAATADNSKCGYWLDKSNDACGDRYPWLCDSHTSVWCNPPYSRGNVIKFMRKAGQESLRMPEGVIAMLVQNDTSTEWGQYALHFAYYAYYPEKRLKFDCDNGAKFASVVYLFGLLDEERLGKLDRLPGKVVLL